MSLFATKAIALSLLALATPALSFVSYINDFGDPVDFHCPDGYALSTIESTHLREPVDKKRSTGDFDRLWDFSCTLVSCFLG